MVFNFGSSLVHDNGTLLLFHKDDLKLRANIRGYAKAYHFSILKDWMRINHLPITSPKDASKIMSSSSLLICFILKHKHNLRFPCCSSLTMLHSSIDAEVLHSTASEELSRGAFFPLRPMAKLDFVGINIAIDDVFFNLVTKDTQLNRGSTPWRGGRKKDHILLQLLIESTTQVGEIVLDCTISIGT